MPEHVDIAFRSRLLGHAIRFVLIDYWASDGLPEQLTDHIDAWESRRTNRQLLEYLVEKDGLLDFYREHSVYFDPDLYRELVSSD